ncbi:MAG: glutaredoxin family protein [bacterium]|nr:glutaredoxin family protein [bacterium]
MSQLPIKIYTLSTCSHCKSVKKFLDTHSVEYEFADVDCLDREERRATMEELKKVNPICSFPTLIIGDDVVVGFKEKKIKEILGL